MFLNTCILLAILGFAIAELDDSETCPNGGVIYAHGIENKYKKEIVDIHNKYRLDIAQGKVKGQPRGVNLKRMEWDNTLSLEGVAVSKTCTIKHVNITDHRFGVGQNLYMSSSSKNSSNQEWKDVIASWFNEHKYFTYPVGSRKGEPIGHYTQIVWADTRLVGCDFISFYDANEPTAPYTKLYTCNYGPGGNIRNSAPYKKGKRGCNNLC